MRDDRASGPIRWCIHLPVQREQVFGALDSDEGRASFRAESAVEEDGVILFRFIDGFAHHAEILRPQPPALYEISYIDGVARFVLQDDGSGGADLLLTQCGGTRPGGGSSSQRRALLIPARGGVAAATRLE